MSARTVQVSNVSLGASERDLQEFFSFSGEIEYVEMQSDTERSQIAFVTFKDSQGAETAVLLSGATIVDMCVNVVLDPDYKLPPAALTPTENTNTNTTTTGGGAGDGPGGAAAAFRKAEDVVSNMLSKGFVLGKDAINKAKSLDEKHQLTSTASAKVAGLTEKISIGTSIVNEKVKEVDQKLQVSEKAKSAFAVAEQKVSDAGSAIMKNRYVFTSTNWVTNAFNKVVTKQGEKSDEKVVSVENEEKRDIVVDDDLAKVHLADTSKESEVVSEEKLSEKVTHVL